MRHLGLLALLGLGACGPRPDLGYFDRSTLTVVASTDRPGEAWQ